MSFEAVDIFVVDTTLQELPIPGVVVAIYDSTGANQITRATTDSIGKVSFLLDAGSLGISYQVRLYKWQVNFANPKTIQVLPAPTTNVFDVEGELFTPPSSADTRICVAYGRFRTGSGGPASFIDLHFIPKFKPAILEGAAILPQRIATRTDRDGYVEIPLIRYAEYDVTVEGIEDVQRTISVPNLANTNLPDLLFPTIGAVSFSPAGPFIITAAESLDVTPTVQATDGRIFDDSAPDEVFWDTDDHTIATVSVVDRTLLVIRGIAPGTCNLTAVRRDTSVVRIPNTPIQGVPVAITVVS
jgi:hypothetical protein